MNKTKLAIALASLMCFAPLSASAFVGGNAPDNASNSKASSLLDNAETVDASSAYESVTQFAGDAYDYVAKGVSNLFGGGSTTGDVGGMVSGGGIGGALGGGGGSSMSGGSLGSTGPGTTVVGAYCGQMGPPIAGQQAMDMGFSNLNSSIGTQISNATNILASTIQTNIAKASVANSSELKAAREQEKKLTEQTTKIEDAQKKALAIVEVQDKVAAEMEMGKLRKTNACMNPGVVNRQKEAETSARRGAGGATQAHRNYSNYLNESNDISDIYEGILENAKALEDSLPKGFVEPVGLTDEQFVKEIALNSLMVNPTPAVSLNEDIANTVAGKEYSVSKAIIDKKSETLAYILNRNTARKKMDIDIPFGPVGNYIEMSVEENSGFKDKDGEYIILKNVDGDKTSLSFILDAQVKQYHQGEEWQASLPTLGLSSKVEELTKISALQLDISYKIYQELMIANELKVMDMQKDTIAQTNALNGIARAARTQ